MMVLLVAFVGWIVLRYARTYMDGEAREGRLHGLLLATLAAVLLLVQAAAWVAGRSPCRVGLVCASCCCSIPTGPRRGGPRPSSRWSGARAISR